MPFEKKQRYAQQIVFEFQMDQNYVQAENIEHNCHRNRYRDHRRRNLIIKKL